MWRTMEESLPAAAERAGANQGTAYHYTVEPLTSIAVFEVNDELETDTVEEPLMRIAPPCKWVVRDG